jgi:hypothetical protein
MAINKKRMITYKQETRNKKENSWDRKLNSNFVWCKNNSARAVTHKISRFSLLKGCLQ